MDRSIDAFGELLSMIRELPAKEMRRRIEDAYDSNLLTGVDRCVLEAIVLEHEGLIPEAISQCRMALHEAGFTLGAYRILSELLLADDNLDVARDTILEWLDKACVAEDEGHITEAAIFLGMHCILSHDNQHLSRALAHVPDGYSTLINKAWWVRRGGAIELTSPPWK